MKKNLLKFYVVTVCLCSTVILAETPGTDDTNGLLEGADVPGAPVDDWIIPFIIVSFVLGYSLIRKRIKNSNAI
jgi:hypothetical protein